MTGKELLIALLGAGVVGGAAGAGANLAMPAKEAPAAPDATADLARRLDATEKELASAKEALESARKEQLALAERLTKSEIASAHRAESSSGAVAAKPVGRRVRVGEPAAAELKELEDCVVEGLDGGEMFGGELLGGGGPGGEVEIALGQALEGLAGPGTEIHTGLESLSKGFALRRLPEAERWEKARTELGLSWNQVEDLKRAVADRDKAVKDATTTETKTRPDGSKITIQRPDPAKRAHAEAAYHDRVNQTLGEEGRKNWDAKGYDHAFGSGLGGGNMAIAIDMRRERKGEAPPKDETK